MSMFGDEPQAIVAPKIDSNIKVQVVDTPEALKKLVRELNKAQVISYLKATGLSLGLLINFNVPVLKTVSKELLSNSLCLCG